MDLLSHPYLPYILVALLAGAIVGFLLFRPRQRVRLSDTPPLRPHMAGKDAAPAADVQVEPAQPQSVEAAAPAGEADDFQRMKGVGAKFAEALRSKGFFRFDQLASLDDESLAQVDEDLGTFSGRLRRDRIAEQARFLAECDIQGFEQHFGKLQR